MWVRSHFIVLFFSAFSLQTNGPKRSKGMILTCLKVKNGYILSAKNELETQERKKEITIYTSLLLNTLSFPPFFNIFLKYPSKFTLFKLFIYLVEVFYFLLLETFPFSLWCALCYRANSH